jgi:hypothetical protein
LPKCQPCRAAPISSGRALADEEKGRPSPCESRTRLWPGSWPPTPPGGLQQANRGVRCFNRGPGLAHWVLLHQASRTNLPRPPTTSGGQLGRTHPQCRQRVKTDPLSPGGFGATGSDFERC